jgi:hypothetical protein
VRHTRAFFFCREADINVYALGALQSLSVCNGHNLRVEPDLIADTNSQLPFISSLCPTNKGPQALTAAGLGDVFGRYCTNAFSTYAAIRLLISFGRSFDKELCF